MSAISQRTQAAAKLLLDARRSRQRLVELPIGLRPPSTREAYAIQDAVLAELGRPGGWKVGARTPDAEPTCAPLPADLILRSPQRFPAGAFARNGVEAELAFTLGRDLPPRATRYDEAELRGAIASVHAAIEVVDSRFVDMSTIDAASLLADLQSNGALVVGGGVPLPASFPAINQKVELIVDGAEQDTDGRNPAGSLMRLMTWLADHVAARRGGLRRGDIITTGSWTGMRFFPAGTRIDVDFPGIGGAHLVF
ncbi:MAG TPA: fumarylacetoacetate hydrolase family protein [Casimicrobiaceae bacterium]|nr:fumarylacetoacetate hydrolase family protein [Casimicrobiaceae bacterium]